MKRSATFPHLGAQAAMNVAASVVGGAYLVWLVGYLVNRVGANDFGVWVSIGAILSPLAVLDAGLSLVVVRAAADRLAGSESAAHDARAATSLYAILGTLALGLGAALALLPERLLDLSADAAEQARLVAWILAADYALLLATAAWGAVLRGTRRYGAVFVAAVVQAVVGVALTVLLVDDWGLPGAAGAQIAAHAAGRLTQLIAVRRIAPWFRATPDRPEAAFVRRVARFAAPLVVIAVAAQLSFATDVLVVGAIAGASAASWIAVGARLPALAVALVRIAADVLFPVFVEQRHDRRAADSGTVRFGIRLATFVGSATFVSLLLARDPILRLWIGDYDVLASTVFAIYCLTWMVHMPAHILALVMVARGRHSIMAPVVLGEAIVNISLSVALVTWVGPVGAAIASLTAVGISNVTVLPLVARQTVGVGLRSSAAQAAIGAIVGAGVSVAAYSLAHGAGLPVTYTLLAQAVLTAVGGAAGAWILWRHGPKPSIDAAAAT